MTESTTTTRSAIVWFELPSADTEKARSFYSGLLGWSFEDFGGRDYHASTEAGGAVQHDPAGGGPLVYFGVADVDAAAATVRRLGGTAGDREEIPGVGFYAKCVDLDGNRFGLYQALAG